jgi:hypothetical protein
VLKQEHPFGKTPIFDVFQTYMTLFQSNKTKSWVGRRRWGGRNKNKRKEKEEQWWVGRKKDMIQSPNQV